MEWLQIIFYLAVFFIGGFNFFTFTQENKRMQESNLRAEANRDRSNDWERHRG